MAEAAAGTATFAKTGTGGFAHTDASNPFIAELGLLQSLAAERPATRTDFGAGNTGGLAPATGGEHGTYRAVSSFSESKVARSEVQSLPVYGKLALGVSSTGHAGIKEMQIARKARHEAAVEGYNTRVAGMEVDLEARTGRLGRDFKALLSLNDAEIQSVFDHLVADFLLAMELSDVLEARQRLDEHAERRTQWIDSFEADLAALEGERKALVRHELAWLMDALVQTAHLLPAELGRLVEGLAHDVNVLILGNREVHATLVAKLRIAEVKRVQAHADEWAERLAEWRRLRHTETLKRFRAFVHTEEVVKPPKRAQLLAALGEMQTEYQKRREGVVTTLGGLAPPHLTADAAGRVRTELDALHADEVRAADVVVSRAHTAPLH